MLVGAYPFERPEDKTDPQKLQKMIQRILRVDYSFPPHVKLSPELEDIMKRILVSDPSKRITMAGILEHPWYNKDLPPGVKQMNDKIHLPSRSGQSEEQIRAVVEEARNPGADHSQLSGWEDYIDDTLDDDDDFSEYS